MISPCQVSTTIDGHQHLSCEGISRGKFAWDGESFALGEVAVSEGYRQTARGVTKFVASRSRNVTRYIQTDSPRKRSATDPMKNAFNTVLDPTRRSNDARDFDNTLRRKIVGQDACA